MNKLQSALVAIDLNAKDSKALRALANIVAAFNSKVFPAYVVDTGDGSFSNEQRRVVRAQAFDRLRELTADPAFQHLEVEAPVVLFGKPAEELIRYAEARDVNMILAGAGGDPETEFTGPVAEQLIRNSPTAVWLVRQESPGLPKRLLCPVDATAGSDLALRNAVHIARHLQAELIVLHVVEETRPWYAPLVAPETVRPSDPEAVLDTHLKPIDQTGVSTRREVRHGRPAEQIHKAARDLDVDLIVMGSAGRTGLERLVLGSVAAGVLRGLPCSLVSVKTDPVIRVDVSPRVKDFQVHFARAIDLSREGFAHEALHELRRCLDLSPVSPQVWLAMADVYARIGDDARARGCRKRADAVARTINEQRLLAEIRSEHWMWNRG